MNNPTYSTTYDDSRYDYEIVSASDTWTNESPTGEYLGEELIKATEAGYSKDGYFIFEYIEDETYRTVYASTKKEALEKAEKEFYLLPTAWNIDLKVWLDD